MSTILKVFYFKGITEKIEWKNVKIKKTVEYVNGIKHGLCRIYNKNDKVASIKRYNNGHYESTDEAC
jgi:antitoxin component YwqK of YwqJK toxin-antitoxin module